MLAPAAPRRLTLSCLAVLLVIASAPLARAQQSLLDDPEVMARSPKLFGAVP